MREDIRENIREDIRHLPDIYHYGTPEGLPTVPEQEERSSLGLLSVDINPSSHDTQTNFFTSSHTRTEEEEMSSLPMTEKIMLDDDDYAREEYDPDMPVEQRLMKNLLQNYERSVRPVRNATDMVIVKMVLSSVT